MFLGKKGESMPASANSAMHGAFPRPLRVVDKDPPLRLELPNGLPDKVANARRIRIRPPNFFWMAAEPLNHLRHGATSPWKPC